MMPLKLIVARFRLYRCACGGVLDYDYHIFWRCRNCGKTVQK